MKMPIFRNFMNKTKMNLFGNFQEICDTLEYAIFIIKPDAMNYREEIILRIIKENFHILSRKKFQLFPEQAAEFLKDYEQLKPYMILVYNLSSGPIDVMLLAKVNCIEDLACLIGPERPSQANFYFPKSLRAIYGNKFDDLQNAIHGSRSHKDAVREIHFFFPNFIIEPTYKKDAEYFYCQSNIIELLLEGLQKIASKKPSEPIFKLSKWWLENNPDQPIVNKTKINGLHEKINFFDGNIKSLTIASSDERIFAKKSETSLSTSTSPESTTTEIIYDDPFSSNEENSQTPTFFTNHTITLLSSSSSLYSSSILSSLKDLKVNSKNQFDTTTHHICKNELEAPKCPDCKKFVQFSIPKHLISDAKSSSSSSLKLKRASFTSTSVSK